MVNFRKILAKKSKNLLTAKEKIFCQNFRPIFLIFSLFVFVSLFARPFGSQAIGLITKPIVIDNAMRGQVIKKKLTVLNTRDKEIEINLEAEGDISDWVKFYLPNKMDQATTSLKLTKRQTAKILAVITVPADALNGEYHGFLSVIEQAQPQEESQKTTASILQKVSRRVTIKVTDIEDISFKATIIPISYDIGLGEPLKLRVLYTNQGNVLVKPQLEVKIKQADNVLNSVIFPYPAQEDGVKPLADKQIPVVEIPTSSLKPGKYVAIITAKFKDKTLEDKVIRFTVHSQKQAAGQQAQSREQAPFSTRQLVYIILVAVVLMGIGTFVVKMNGRFKGK